MTDEPSDAFGRSRLIAFDAVQNFRDLGGYSTITGGTVAWGRLFRSAVLAQATAADQRLLAELRIHTVIDLRTDEERRRHPSRWLESAGIVYWAHAYVKTAGPLADLLAKRQPTREDAREAMHAIYRELPYEQAPALRELLHRARVGDLPLVFGCTAGKDRTGLAAALMLSALGVPRPTVLADYEMTGSVLNVLRLPSDASPHSRSRELDAAIRAPLVRSDPAYLATALSVIETAHGSIEGYLTDVLRFDAGSREELRARLLE